MANFIIQNPWVIILIILWSIYWKGVALWKAARNNQLNWFIVLLIVNTLGILEIIYIYGINKKEEIKLPDSNLAK